MALRLRGRRVAPSSGRGLSGRRRHLRRSPAALAGEFTVLAIAGFLFAVSAQTANGTQLRSDRPDAAGLLRAEQARYQARAERAAALQREVDALTARAAKGDSAVAAVQGQSQGLLASAGLQAVHGAGVTVTLDDAPRTGSLPPDVRPDDLVVHQQDVQAVVNALWAGGAEAIQLMDQRVISTSAVRCVGNTLILQGRVYSPPYRVTAVGNVPRLMRAIDDSPQITIYQEYVQALGLGWSVVRHDDVTVPAYTGSLELRYATVPGAPASSGTAESTTGTAGTTGTGGSRDGGSGKGGTPIPPATTGPSSKAGTTP